MNRRDRRAAAAANRNTLVAPLQDFAEVAHRRSVAASGVALGEMAIEVVTGLRNMADVECQRLNETTGPDLDQHRAAIKAEYEALAEAFGEATMAIQRRMNQHLQAMDPAQGRE